MISFDKQNSRILIYSMHNLLGQISEKNLCRRLDRFLCSTGCEDIFPEARQTALARVISDHCPIQLDTNKVKWGPCPFRFENMWLQDPEFRNKFKEWWQSEQVEGWEGYKFMIKLKAMKKKVQS
ncbi:hypothetical protein C1H46_008582 [Malus baccata]|uniref:Endonuclease/exonuclease/phosphatase domain-containing protein n=1 Tax=Malus baccata TaxID=106549 RepID=A0A540N4F6_MALBA|nr:hypothetical protein C1H46_008582 [Malus baccata]